MTDVTMAEQYKNDIVRTIATFASTNQSFFFLTQKNREAVFTYISINITNQKFQDENKETVAPLLKVNSTLVSMLKGITTNLVETNSLDPKVKEDTLGVNYVIGCALAAIGGTLLSYGDAINDIKYIITQGWSGMALVNAAIDILSNASPWWKVAGIALTFGGCLLSGIN